jgi:hypothetical protein
MAEVPGNSKTPPPFVIYFNVSCGVPAPAPGFLLRLSCFSCSLPPPPPLPPSYPPSSASCSPSSSSIAAIAAGVFRCYCDRHHVY